MMEVALLLGGSPCQSLSITQSKTRQGLDGKSKLFFEYVRALEELKPKYWLFENVASMDGETKDLMSEIFGCEPIMIDSNLVSAQDRKRYYWTNIPGVTQPTDKGLILKDIVVDSVDVPKKYWYDCGFEYHGEDKKVQCTLDIKGHDILKRVYNINDKCGTLTMVSGGSQQKKVFQDGKCRKLMPLEYERLQNVPDNYTYGVSDTARYSMLGNGWTIWVILHILSFIPEEELDIIVSVFDGMSCGQIAINTASKSYNRYYSSEIEPKAIQITQKNYPSTIQLGNVTKINWSNF